MAKKHLVLILTEPTEGREQEYNDYYENLHLREVIETTNLKTAQRFRSPNLAQASFNSHPTIWGKTSVRKNAIKASGAESKHQHSPTPERPVSVMSSTKTAYFFVHFICGFQTLPPRSLSTEDTFMDDIITRTFPLQR